MPAGTSAYCRQFSLIPPPAVNEHLYQTSVSQGKAEATCSRSPKVLIKKANSHLCFRCTGQEPKLGETKDYNGF